VRVLRATGDRLPKGWGDLLRQLLLFFAAYNGYQLVRGMVDGKQHLALANAERVIHLERSLGLFFEPHLQHAALSDHWLIDIMNWMYLNSHFIVTTSFLIWLYLARNDHFYFVRNMFLVAMGLALVGYAAFPTAPPRFVHDAGFTDTIARFTNVQQDSGISSLLVNPYAAVPSMHIAFALMISIPGLRLTRNLPGRCLWTVYPVIVFFVIVLTANHYWFDAACGALVAGASAVVAHRLGALEQGWSWRRAAEEATA
jgi:PAP2 superfamily